MAWAGTSTQYDPLGLGTIGTVYFENTRILVLQKLLRTLGSYTDSDDMNQGI